MSDGDGAKTVRLPDDVVAWIGEVTGGRLAHADRIPGGGRKEGWFVDIDRGAGQVDELYLRLDRSDPASTGDPWTVRREATIYRALEDTAVPVPRVQAMHPTLEAMLSERVGGRNWFSRIADPEEALATARDFIGHLAALHRVDPAGLDLPGFPPVATIPDHVRHELDEWEALIEHRGGDPDPALRFTLDWLRRNIPDHDGPVVLVQGDTGPGNFMYEGGHVTAIVDWELAHLGDPMDDIAWLSLRSVQEPFTHLPDRLREYEELSGHEVDDDRVHYYRVMAEAKLLVMGHGRDRDRSRAGGEGGGGDVGNGLIYGMLHRRLWLEAMAQVVGIEPPPALAPPERSPAGHAWLYGAMLGQLREVIVPRIDDPLASQRAKGLARIVKYLAAIDRDGAWYAAREMDELTELLGERPATLEAGRAAEGAAARSGAIGDLDHFRYLWRRVAVDDALMREASGALADRHWPPLR
jgi:aminoglycoside phosphotransferase (APT) family kinase protein